MMFFSRDKKSKRKKTFIENVRTFFSAVLIALLIRVFLIEPYKIPTGSMIPTLIVGDQLLVNKFLYGVRIPVFGWKLPAFTVPARGDIVVFHYPKYQSPGIYLELLDLFTFGLFGLTNTSDDPKNFIKRVVGMPGDRIRFDKQKFFISSYDGDNNLLDVNIDYQESLDAKEYFDLISKAKKIRIPAPMYYFPFSISVDDFHKRVIEKISSLEDKNFIKNLYQFDSFENKYRLVMYISESIIKKTDDIFSSIDFPKPFYRKKSDGSYFGYNDRNQLKVETFNFNSKNSFSHLIQIENPFGSMSIDFLYIPKYNDSISLELKVNYQGKADDKILFSVNDKLITVLSVEEYLMLDKKFYSGIIDNVLEAEGNVVRSLIRENYYFMVGDNRDVSSDSREWGFISEKDIIGSPIVIYWPYFRFGKIIS